MKDLSFDKILTKQWAKMPYWYGNPDLNFECWGKKIGKYRVYVAGKTDRHLEPHCIDDYFYVIRGEMSGMYKSDTSAEDLMKYVDFRHELGILNHGRSFTCEEEKQFQLR